MRKYTDTLAKSPVVNMLPPRRDTTRTESKVGRTVLNAVAFQGAWLDLLIFDTGIALFFITVLLVQFIYVFKEQSLKLVLPMLGVLSSGLLLDSMLSLLGFFSFPESTLVATLMPGWLIALWFAFVLSLPISFYWVLHKPELAIGIFACMAPLSYMAGRHIGVIDFSNMAILLIAGGWALLAMLSCRWLGAALNIAPRAEKPS